VINWSRWLVRLLLIIIVGVFERVMGLPVVMIVLTSLYAGRLDRFWRWGLLLVVGVLTAALFMTPLFISWLIVSLSYIWTNHTRQFFPSKTIRLTMGGLIGSVVLVIFGLGQINFRQLIYGMVAIIFCAVWLKRHRFYLK
jgi:hypothetical protein